MIGLILVHDRTYFFWPPQFANYFNSYFVGVIGGIAGLGLIIYGLTDKHNDYIVGLLLAVSAGFASILFFAELLPVVGINYFHWHIGTVLLIFYLIEIMKVAYLRKPSQRNWKGETHLSNLLGYVLPFLISLVTLFLNYVKSSKKSDRTNLDDENDRLNERIKRLTARVDQLEDENEKLRKENHHDN